ncbi:MAG: SDR family oxidoreductase [Rubrivivax sp.]
MAGPSFYEHLQLAEQDGVATVTLNRPERLNALNPRLIAELNAFFGGLNARSSSRVVVLRGAGRAFCAGLDLKDMQANGARRSVDDMLQVQKNVRDVMLAMRRCPQPIISIVQGAASGGGFALALASDIRLLTPDARMNAAFIRIGLSGCDVGVSYFLPRMVGASVAAEYILTGRFMDAQRALALGLDQPRGRAVRAAGRGPVPGRRHAGGYAAGPATVQGGAGLRAGRAVAGGGHRHGGPQPGPVHAGRGFRRRRGCIPRQAAPRLCTQGRRRMRPHDLPYREGLLTGQRILVTGGGTGLGRTMAEAFLMLGADVVICGRRLPVLEDAAAALTQAHGGRVQAIACDIRDETAVAAMVGRIWAEGGALTGLVNNAAGNFISRTQDLSPRGFDAIANIVFRGSFLVTLECGKRWIAEGHKASVLSILVSWVWNGSPFAVPSAMSKAGLHAMTQSLAVEWGPRGIRCNAIAPGLFPTEGMLARLDPTGGSFDPVARNPLRRAGQMAELASLAVYLMAPGSEYVNGQTIAIDGGEYQATGANFSHLSAWTGDDWARAAEAIRRRKAA